jgi:polycystin 1L2
LNNNSDSCQVPKSIDQLISKCESDYSLLSEEQESFEPGWMINQTTVTYSSSIRQAFIYQSSNKLDTYTYVGDYGTYNGDGYMYEFRGSLSDLHSNLSQLHQLEWIDEQTRAVIIQMSLYNPNVEMFTSVTFLIEFLSTGGVYPTSLFEPLHFQGQSFIFTKSS